MITREKIFFDALAQAYIHITMRFTLTKTTKTDGTVTYTPEYTENNFTVQFTQVNQPSKPVIEISGYIFGKIKEDLYSLETEVKYSSYDENDYLEQYA